MGAAAKVREVEVGPWAEPKLDRGWVWRQARRQGRKNLRIDIYIICCASLCLSESEERGTGRKKGYDSNASGSEKAAVGARMEGREFPNKAVSMFVADEECTATELESGARPAHRIGGGVGAAGASSEPAPVEPLTVAGMAEGVTAKPTSPR